MSHFKPVPAPRIKISVDLHSPPPIPPKPIERILRNNSERSNLNLDIPLETKRGFKDTSIKPPIGSKSEIQILKGNSQIDNLKSYIPSVYKTGFNSSTSDKTLQLAKPGLHINKNVTFRNTVEIHDSQQKPIQPQYDVIKELLSPFDLPPPLPPKPKPLVQRSSFTSKLNKVIKENDPLKSTKIGLLKSVHSFVEETIDELTEDANKQIKEDVNKQEEKNTVIAETKHLENIAYELENFSKKLLNSELQYIEKLEEALEGYKELHSILPESVVTKFFGLLEDIHTLHQEIFYKEFNRKMNNPKALLHCFLKHELKFSVYIERQWLVLKKVHLTEFEKFIIEERRLMQYIKISKGRIMDYIKILTYIKPCIQKEESETDDYIFLINEAIRVVENVYYQLEMTEKLQSIENIRNKFKDCGEVYLHDTFKISINGSKPQKCQVYFCKNLILFAKVEESGNIRYYDDILVSDSYCVLKSKSKKVFEIGTKSRNRYILKSDLQSTRDKWCERLKEVLTFEKYTEI